MKNLNIRMAALLSAAGMLSGAIAAENGKITENFNQPPKKDLLWLVPGFQVLPDGGLDNSGCLFTDKTEAGKMQITTYTLYLKPDTKYRAAVRCKAENLKDVRGSRLFCIEFTDKGKYVSGAYYTKPLKENSWETIVLEFTAPAQFNAACAGFYLPKSATGKVWWDDFSLEEVK